MFPSASRAFSLIDLCLSATKPYVRSITVVAFFKKSAVCWVSFFLSWAAVSVHQVVSFWICCRAAKRVRCALVNFLVFFEGSEGEWLWCLSFLCLSLFVFRFSLLVLVLFLFSFLTRRLVGKRRRPCSSFLQGSNVVRIVEVY